MRALLLSAMVLLLAGCHDWDKEYAGCVTSGKCGELTNLNWSTTSSRPLGVFGDVPVAALSATTLTITNNTQSSLHDFRVLLSGANADRFGTVGGDSCDTAEFVSGGSCTLRVAFVPDTEKTFSAQLRAVSAEGGATVALSGQGVPATYILAVNLARSESVVVTYNDPALGEFSRPVTGTGVSYFSFLGETALVIDVGLSGLTAGPIWGGDCPSASGQKCSLQLTTTKPTATASINFTL